ncbi:MAG: alpha/beta hydrolase [Pseudomonadota bacterium]
MRFSFALAAVLLAGCATTPQTASVPGLHAETFGPARGLQVRTLIVVLHGEGQPSHYRFAQAAAAAVPGSAAVAILRPGYADAAGKASPGERGTETGDNYTADRIDAVGDSIAALRQRYPNARTLIVGDSGGAVIAANLAGIRPGLVDGMVLVGCPCALPEWRKLMKWNGEVASLDPLKTAGGIMPGLRAAVLVGAEDKITPVKFSRAYAEALTLRGIATDYRIVPGKGHDLLNDPEVLATTQRLAASLPRKT